MSLTFDQVNGTNVVDYTGTATISWTHTPVSTPVAVTLNVMWHTDPADPTGNFVSGITYGGVALTQVGAQTISAFQNEEKWILVSPPSGPQTLAFTWGFLGLTRGRATSTTFKSAGSATYGTLQTATGTTTPITKTVAGVLATSTLDTIGGVHDGTLAAITITVNGTGETRRSGVTTLGLATDNSRGQVYTSTQTGSGSVTANATESANRNWGIMVLELKELVIAVASGKVAHLGSFKGMAQGQRKLGRGGFSSTN